MRLEHGWSGGGNGQFLHPGGRVCVYCPHAVHAHAHPRAHAPKPSTFFRWQMPKEDAIFLHGFAAVTAVAKALQVAFHEQLHVATMGNDVVNVCRPSPDPVDCTRTAPGFSQELILSALPPAIPRICVQVMPGSGFLPHRLGLMSRAVAI